MNIRPATPANLQAAADLLRAGKLVAFPTETVYGLGANALSDLAVAEIYQLKQRPSFNPLIVHVANNVMAKKYVTWNAAAQKLVEAFWPGPLTLILPRLRSSGISLLASAGGDTVGIRMPRSSIAQDLIREAGVPLAAPSANRSGRVSPTAAQHVRDEFGDKLPLILDGGACEVGIESTVVDVSDRDAVLLRPGLITHVQLEQVLGTKVLRVEAGEGAIKSPGMLASHYAPSLPVRLNVTYPQTDEVLLAFGTDIPQGAKHVVFLSNTGNLKEAAASLFASLREADKPETYSSIAIMPIPDEGIGIAINDRLRRAAMPV